ncbi:MAG: ComEC/Rec2 family competence protein [Clostridia bacterium]|nr:ComEC/Rec2 family competence protein [Clostridia bacterium]
MNLFGKRPLALFCVSFAAAAVLGLFMTLQNIEMHLFLAIFLSTIAALLLAVPLFLHRFSPRLLTPALALIFASLALVQSWFGIGSKLKAVSSLTHEVTCQILVKEEYYAKSYLSTYRAEILSIDGKPLGVMGEVSLPFDAEWKVGDVVSGDFSVISVNNGSENTLYRMSDKILIELDSDKDSLSVIDYTAPDKLTIAISSLREQLSTLIGRFVMGEEGDLVSSLFLNKRELLEDQTALTFRRTGTTHLLAISGMHLSILILLVEKLLRTFSVKKNARCIAVLLITLFYLTLTGFALSACRAFLMCCFVYLSWLFRSDNDPVTSLFFSLFLILVISPYSVCDIGMWMSVLAVLGILIAMRFLEAMRDRLRKKGVTKIRLRVIMSVFSSVLIALAAEIFILFPMWLAFDELSLVALPCGILLSPLVTLVLLLTPIMLVFSWLPFVASFLGSLLYAVCHVMLEAVSFFSSFQGITVSLGHRFFNVLIPLSSVLIALILIVKLKRKWLLPAAMGGTVLAVALFLCALRLPPVKSMTADYLRLNENELMLFSYGEASVICDSTNGALSSVYPTRELLCARQVTEIEAYVLTHYHTRHVSMLNRLVSTLPVHAFYLPLPNSTDENQVFSSVLSLADEHGITVLLYDRNTPLAFGPLTLTVSSEVYLKRSTQPIFYVTAHAFDKELIYISESTHESLALHRELCDKTPEADYLLLGIHGPITKQPFSYPLGDALVFLSDFSLVDHFVLQDAPNGKIVCDSTHISIPLQKDDKN